MKTLFAWPAVFRDTISAPYRPDITDPWQRRGLAIADGLKAWVNCHAAMMLDLTIPSSFGEVIIKLQDVAGIADSTQEAFSDAASAWNNDREK